MASAQISAVNRLHQLLLISSSLLASWLGMQAVHELGHCAGAWLTGGRVERVILHPLTISRTDLAENPHPLLVAWAGPVIGILVPLLFWGIAGVARLSAALGLRCFAGFCLIANGLYIGFGSVADIGDCGEMLLHGSVRWHLWLFGLFTAPVGLWLWHGLGSHFGLGPAARPISRYAVCAALAVLVALVTLELLFSRISAAGTAAITWRPIAGGSAD